MNSLSSILRRNRGGYIVEASLIMPILIISIIALVTIIRLIACELQISFITADEMYAHQIKSGLVGDRLTSEIMTVGRIMTTVKEADYVIPTEYKCDYEDDSTAINHLTKTAFVTSFGRGNKYGFFVPYDFEFKVTGRSFCGYDNSMRDDGDRLVYVFPKNGKVYHTNNCKHVKKHIEATVLTSQIKKKYKACAYCKSKKLAKGENIILFKYGGDYHRSNCPFVKKEFKVVKIKKAKGIGFSPCKECGG